MKIYLMLILLLTFALVGLGQENKPTSPVRVPTNAQPLPATKLVNTQKVVVEKTSGEQLSGDFLGGNIATVTLKISGQEISIRTDEIKLIRFGGNSDQAASADAGTSEQVKTISVGVLNGKAIKLGQPVTPAAARAVRAAGTVNVQVTIDTDGNVISASAVSGHPLLRQAAEQAALESKFSRTMLSGKSVKVKGIIIFNFAAQ